MHKLIQYSRGVLLLLFVFITSACSAVTKEPNNVKMANKEGNLEVIYGFDIKEDSFWFLVKSNGCTKVESFTLQHSDLDNKTTEVALYRTKRDLCRGLTKIISIEMPIQIDDITDKHFIVTNPTAAKPARTKR